jgi:pimeloyl-ACP methyl ester carboxylesterase
MKKIFFTLLITLLYMGAMANEHSVKEGRKERDQFAGKWFGDLRVNPNFKLLIAFEITALAGGDYEAIMHSADQKSFNITVDRVVAEGDSIILEIKMLASIYKGQLTTDSISNKKTLIQGNLGNPGNRGLTLTLQKCEEFPFHIAKRPQEPKKPYSYHSEDVTFTNTEEKISLSGTFTKPFGVERAPAVVLISGSGPSDRNQTIFGHKVFLVLADYLTRNGIAVLRYDDRGAGESQGSFRNATVRDHAADASYAIEYLKSRADVDSLRVGLIGHSLGAEIAPITATINSSTAFIVLMAGSAISLKEVIFEQCDAVFTSRGASKEGIALNREILESTMEIFKNSVNDSIAKEDIKRDLLTFDSRVSALTQSDREKIGLSSPLKLSDYSSLLMPFMRYDLFHNPSETLKQVKCPVFALIGDKDIQVLPYNLDLIEQAAKSGGNTNIKTKLYKNRNHLLQNCTTGAVEEYGDIEETISEEVINDIIEWILIELFQMRA